jgi:hypothetical protein
MTLDSQSDTTKAGFGETGVSHGSQDIITSQVFFAPEVERKLVRKIDKK